MDLWYHMMSKFIWPVRLQLVDLSHFLCGPRVSLRACVLPAGHRVGRPPGLLVEVTCIQCSTDLQYQQLFINLMRPKPTLKTNISCMNNVFVIFSSFVYDSCVNHIDLHCQSWDITLSTKVAEYKQQSSVLIYIF